MHPNEINLLKDNQFDAMMKIASEQLTINHVAALTEQFLRQQAK